MCSVAETAVLGYPLLGASDILERLCTAVAEQRPFSLIRIGDGEAVVLSYGDDMWLQDIAHVHGHWGHERVTLGDVAVVQDDLESAISGARRVALAHRSLSRLSLSDHQVCCSAWIHWELLRSVREELGCVPRSGFRPRRLHREPRSSRCRSVRLGCRRRHRT
ncbi:hypothetical protein [Ilumatobacter sp.]|uniref:GT-D fold domain-containing protein n=1 Tax=Ilumatobacter sp. TaxID=1967498 RepID=UPI003C6F2839